MCSIENTEKYQNKMIDMKKINTRNLWSFGSKASFKWYN